jgi:hypothetical protein
MDIDGAQEGKRVRDGEAALALVGGEIAWGAVEDEEQVDVAGPPSG